MNTKSKIEWTESTWNPVTGCTKVSPGCKYCYAETMARRLKAMGVAGYEHGFQLQLQPHRLEEPYLQKKPTVYFVNSMSDLFHELVPDRYIESVLRVITETPRHTYQILTKRAERIEFFFRSRVVPENAWLGISAENREYGLPRMQLLQKIDAKTHFISAEPLLDDLGELNLSNIEWVIVGGESGPKARPMKAEWVENIKRQCEAQGVAFFFKQWGGWGADGIKRSKKANGNLYQGKKWQAYPS
jgi:protein gp37